MSSRINLLCARVLTHCRQIGLVTAQRSLSSSIVTGTTDQLERSSTTGRRLNLLRPNLPVLSQTRGKKKGRGQQKEESSDDESDADGEDKKGEDDEVVGVGYTDDVLSVASTRIDTVLKTGTHFGRTKVEEAFYENRIRLNGERISKKSHDVVEGDELDIIIGRNQENNDFLDITRVQIKNIPDIASGTGRLKMSIRKFKQLTIANYEGDHEYDGVVINAKDPNDRW